MSTTQIEINGKILELTQTEHHFALDCLNLIGRGGAEYAQRHIDVLLRDAWSEKVKVRRQALARALGLNPGA